MRKEILVAVHHKLQLPACNRRFGTPLAPFFQPLVVGEMSGPWSLSEDYAFCERARQCGLPVVANTSIRLWHVGAYRYGWEDAGSPLSRVPDYMFRVSNAPGEPRPIASSAPVPITGFTEDWFTYNVPVWECVLATLVGKPVRTLKVGCSKGGALCGSSRTCSHIRTRGSPGSTRSGAGPSTRADLSGVEARFRANTARFGDKVIGHAGLSQDLLRERFGEIFDLIYLDGSHEAPDVLADAGLVWPLLAPGGVLGFDNYGWRVFPEPERCPALAIDAFLGVMCGRFETLERGHQIWVRKFT